MTQSHQRQETIAILSRVLSSPEAAASSRCSSALALSHLLSSERDIDCVEVTQGLEALAATLLPSHEDGEEEDKTGTIVGEEGSAASFNECMAAVAQLSLVLCHWPRGRTALVEAKLLPPLVRCLWIGGGNGGSGSSSAAAEAAARALRLLVTCEEPPTGRPAVIRAGGMFALVHTCGEGSPRAQEAAARALEALSSSSAIKEVLGRVGAIPTLVRQLHGRSAPGHRQQRPPNTKASSGDAAAEQLLLDQAVGDTEAHLPR